jgi:hypothetical protein
MNETAADRILSVIFKHVPLISFVTVSAYVYKLKSDE